MTNPMKGRLHICWWCRDATAVRKVIGDDKIRTVACPSCAERMIKKGIRQ